MSRMIFAICSLALLSGCQCIEMMPNRISLLTARVETMGPQSPVSFRSNCACDGCVPHRPYTCGYCPCWDDMITEHTAQVCAFRALREYRQSCGTGYSHHFKMGFIAAYEDLALNRSPRPPVIPPAKYWNAYYRSCAGQASVDEWFAGYDAGMDMGQNSGVSKFNELYLNRGGCGNGSCDGGGMNNACGTSNPVSTPAYPQPMTSVNYNQQTGNANLPPIAPVSHLSAQLSDY